MINVVVIEDNNTIREGLKILIDGTNGYKCSAAYSGCETMLENIKNFQEGTDPQNPDVLLMDIQLQGMHGIEGIKKIKSLLPDLTILVLTIYEENNLIFDAIYAGASGYLVKKTPPAKLLDAIQEAYQGGAPMSSNIARKVFDLFQQKKQAANDGNKNLLTSSEKEILSKLIEGSNFKAIADTLEVSMDTLRFHVRNIYKKLHSHSQALTKEIK